MQIPRGEEMCYGTVKRRKRDESGNLIGNSNPNPHLDTAVCEVEFADGAIEEFSADITAENMCAQVDDDGWTYQLEEIVDHWCSDEALGP